MESNKTLLFAKNIPEVLFQMKNNPGLEIVGGCTLKRELPEKTLSVKNIAELKMINRHERFIDLGPAVTLNEILDLGDGRVPKILYSSARSTANHFIRNMATLGGNLCSKETKGTLYAPLLALDSVLRFRNTESQNIQTLPIEKFNGVLPKSILINIRVPDEDWDVSIFRRCGPHGIIDKNCASFCFLAKTEKSVLTNARITFAGAMVFSSRELENKLLGMRLPISEKAIVDFTDSAEKEFDAAAEGIKYNPLLKRQFLNLMQYSLNQLTL